MNLETWIFQFLLIGKTTETPNLDWSLRRSSSDPMQITMVSQVSPLSFTISNLLKVTWLFSAPQNLGTALKDFALWDQYNTLKNEKLLSNSGALKRSFILVYWFSLYGVGTCVKVYL